MHLMPWMLLTLTWYKYINQPVPVYGLPVKVLCMFVRASVGASVHVYVYMYIFIYV